MNLNEVAAKYIGITEKPNNGGFSDPDFEARMRKDGEWQKGWAWCACFVQLCVAEWKGEEFKKDLDELLTPSVWQTLINLQSVGYELKDVPKVGDLAIWLTVKNGMYTKTGHIGIVSKVDLESQKTPFHSIEGNTNMKGEREGECVAEKPRQYLWNLKNGLRLMGFISL